MPGPAAVAIILTDAERLALERLVRAQHTSQVLARRARLVLAAAGGATNAAIARELHCDVDRVRDWRTRWVTTTVGTPAERLADEPRSGAPARITPEQVCQIIALACEPPRGSDRPISQWSGREVADEAISRGLVTQLSARHAARLLKRGICSHTAVGTG